MFIRCLTIFIMIGPCVVFIFNYRKQNENYKFMGGGGAKTYVKIGSYI